MQATQRANELFNTKNSDVPANAQKYRDFMCREHGVCSEVVLTAYAHYAQINEGLPCDDEMYKVTDADRMEYAGAIL